MKIGKIALAVAFATLATSQAFAGWRSAMRASCCEPCPVVIDCCNPCGGSSWGGEVFNGGVITSPIESAPDYSVPTPVDSAPVPDPAAEPTPPAAFFKPGLKKNAPGVSTRPVYVDADN